MSSTRISPGVAVAASRNSSGLGVPSLCGGRATNSPGLSPHPSTVHLSRFTGHRTQVPCINRFSAMFPFEASKANANFPSLSAI